MLSYLPTTVEDLREFEPEELGYLLIRHLVDAVNVDSGREHALIFGNLFSPDIIGRNYPGADCKEVQLLLAEAWAWLDSSGLIAASPIEGRPSFFFITRLGYRVAESEEATTAFREAKRLPRDLLHSRVDASSWGPYLRGDYDTAVFTAFKEVEVAVRQAAGFKPGDHGVPMIMEAFKPHVGPLTDAGAEEAEQIALRRLFAGALGSYKNPNSHRHVDLSPHEAAEMIVLASHLLRIVEARTPVPDSDS